MSTQLLLTIPDDLYDQANSVAQAHQLELNDWFITLAKQAISPENARRANAFAFTPDPAVQREKTAYLAMHTTLKESYLGQYVAIHKGQLVDWDEDYMALFQRIDEQYPDQFVWLTQVNDEPTRTITVRSPGFLREV
ncbi:MAG: hypothetical protein KJ063_15125 [Anaerolineae bacterium]|nr:hypothetical protein [Anaerolineae bacterium]